MTDDFTDALEPKTNRPPEEVGREIFRLLDRYDELRVTRAESDYDVRILVPEDGATGDDATADGGDGGK